MAAVRSPIILIGAGRSGSSLLVDLLGSHPGIHMLGGEMELTVGRLWDCLWGTSAAVEARSRLPQAAPAGEPLSDAAIVERARAAERDARARVHALIRDTLDRLFGVSDSPRAYWGFKEIWLDSRSPYSLDLYDAVFPGAFYLHLVRDPFACARSAADWNRRPFTAEELREQLTGWVDCLETNRAAARTGRYLLLTYEALVADPRRALEPLLGRLGLAWDDACLAALKRDHVPSLRRSPFPRRADKLAARVPGLQRLMAELGYSAPSGRPTGKAGASPAAEVATPLGPWHWRLNPPFQADGPCGWVASLDLASTLAGLAPLADDLEDMERSPLRLCEDGRPLGPAHSLHSRIRTVGGGRYSHWATGHMLLFSTPDNSDPNRNNRVYTLTVARAG
jgi:hypothetical protein